MNRLAMESSLYLRQHASNPVDWYPWGPEALDRARQLDRPIFLSVGYSACHWCHVMEHESFENAATAKIMNDHFVNIKVDREERPDLDQIYMTAHHLLNRGEGGGWPLSVFLTPDLTPFYAGTYFPPTEKYGRPSFPRILAAVAETWRSKRDELVAMGRKVAEALQVTGNPEAATTELDAAILTNASRMLRRSFDIKHGGFGTAPKFPHPLELKVLLRLHRRFQDSSALHAARLTLDKMARGGLYDQVGGGFHRYSVDEQWLVPHFEKMLYDNALLPPVYAEAFLITGDPFYKHIACETLDYVLREMTHANGGFFSTLDADSEGEEGRFYIWDEAELDAVLGEQAGFAKDVFGTSSQGNFEGHNILFRQRSDEQDATRLGLDLTTFRNQLAKVKCMLYGRRATRIWPGRDEKFITGWNALMIAAMAQVGTTLNEPKYVAAAVQGAEFVLYRLRSPDGRLYRTCGAEGPAKLTGYLEDYAYLADALISLYEATFNPEWLTTAANLCDLMIMHFVDPDGGFFFTADDHEPLIARTKDMHDGAVPSGNAVAAMALFRLAKLLDRPGFYAAGEAVLNAYQSLMRDTPAAAGQLLIALDLFLGPTSEYVVVGRTEDPETKAILAQLRTRFEPNRVVAFRDPDQTLPTVAMMDGRPMMDERTTVYRCVNQVCAEPTHGLPD